MNAFDPCHTAGITVLSALLATAGPRETAPPTHGREPGQTSKALTAKPDDVKPNPLAQRLCDAFHLLPAKRKSECCGTTPSSLAAVCVRELSASLGRGAVTLDSAAIDRCAAETSRQLDGCGWVTPLMPKLPDTCRKVVDGRLKAGAACRSSLECPEGLFCRGVGPGKEGVCATPGAARTRCEVPADNLAGLVRARDDPRHPVCDGLCIKGQCLPFAPAGGACQSSTQCTPGLHCISGQCQDRRLPRVSESCAGHTSCDAGAYCQAGQCAAVKDAGEACTLPVQCRAFECVMAPGAKVGRCGDPCGPSFPARPSGPAR